MEWKLFADLAELADGDTVEVDVGGEATVRDAVAALVEAHPSLRDRVLTEGGDLRPHVNVLVNGENVRTEGDGLAQSVEAGDELAMFPPVSGG